MCTLIAFPRAKGTDLATPGQHRGAGLGQSLIRFVLSANLIDRLARGGGEDTAPPLIVLYRGLFCCLWRIFPTRLRWLFSEG